MEPDSDTDETHVVRKQAHEYARETSIHGLKYVGEKERTTFERILWLILCILSVSLCTFMIAGLIEKFDKDPIITSIEETNYPVYKVQFPAVTICSNNKVVEKHFKKAMKLPPWNNTDLSPSSTGSVKFCDENDPTCLSEPTLSDTLTKIIEKYVFFSTDPRYLDNTTEHEQYIIDKYAADMPKLMYKVMHHCRDMIVMCRWKGKKIPCMEVFEVRRTDHGFCCSFNNVPIDGQFKDHIEEKDVEAEEDEDYDYYDDDDDDGQGSDDPCASQDGSDNANAGNGGINGGESSDNDGNNNADGDASLKRRKRSATGSMSPDAGKAPAFSPYKINSANTQLGLTILLDPDKCSYWVKENNYVGFRVLVHNPYEYPDVRGKGFAIGQGKEAFLAVSAQVTESTERVKSMSSRRRKCILKYEDLTGTGIEMTAFEEYTTASCLLECRAREIFNECGCLPYYMPEFEGVWDNVEHTTCNLRGLRCLSNVTAPFNALKADEFASGSGCGLLECPNACDETVYGQELSVAEMVVDSNIYDEVLEDLYVLSPEYDEVKAKVAKIIADGGIVPEDLKKEKFEKGVRINNLKKIKDKTREKAVLMHIHFKELGLTKYSRDEIYSMVDVIAACGGIIGLFMGFSLLSGAELIYFFTLRMWVDHSRAQKKKRKVSGRRS